MLVRFLSYAASFIGARRYKVLTLVGMVLLLPMFTIAIIVFTSNQTDHKTASSVQQDGDTTDSSSTPSTDQLTLGRQHTKQNADQVTTEQPQTHTPQPTTDDRQGSAATQPKPATDIALSNGSLTIEQTDQGSLTANTSDGTAATWSVTAEVTSSAITAALDQSRDAASTAVVRVRTEGATPGTYRFTLTAKDASRNWSAVKTIVITVN